MPPEDLLQKIIYEPASVEERGWLVIFNCLVFNGTPADDHPQTVALRARLRWNTWLALDDSSLFLEPSIVNIIALLTVAAHGKDFATPNLSWILTGHACRLAQAINIHILPSEMKDKESRLQRSLVFWSLYTMDKSVSLAFGRPHMLAAPFYDNVPLPPAEDVAEFKPHLKGTGVSNYGGYFLVQSIHLAKLRGQVSDLLQSLSIINNTIYLEKKEKLLRGVTNWNAETQRVNIL